MILYLTPSKHLRHFVMLFSTRLFWYILSLFLLLSLRYAGAVEKNRTIDDPPQNLELGPVYFGPAGAWQHEDCVGCPFQLDRARVFNGTWSVGTAGPFDTISVTFSFTGLSPPVCPYIAAWFFNRNGHLHFLHHPKPNLRREFSNSHGVCLRH